MCSSDLDFDGPIPPELFLRPYDAIFINNNRFTSGIPDTIGKSKASVIVLANNDLGGCIPRTIGEAAATLDQFIFTNNSLTGCLPVEAGLLTTTTVFDVSGNALTGFIPQTLSGLSKVEQLDLSHGASCRRWRTCQSRTTSLCRKTAGAVRAWTRRSRMKQTAWDRQGPGRGVQASARRS